MTDLALTCGRGCAWLRPPRRQGIAAQAIGQQQPRRAAEAPAHRLAPGDPAALSVRCLASCSRLPVIDRPDGSFVATGSTVHLRSVPIKKLGAVDQCPGDVDPVGIRLRCGSSPTPACPHALLSR